MDVDRAGAVTDWPQSLRTATEIMLGTAQPVCIARGGWIDISS
ncbi:hypothetical protein AB5I41_07695 [Sphingomonas sp. MMS24-JH45]